MDAAGYKALKTALADKKYEALDADEAAALYNQDPANRIPLQKVPVENFGDLLLSARLAVTQLVDRDKQAFYQGLFPDLLAIMQIARSADLSRPTVSQFMAQAMADGLITLEQVAEATSVPPSVTADNIFNARKGDW